MLCRFFIICRLNILKNKNVDRLIDWSLMPTLAVFQLYHGVNKCYIIIRHLQDIKHTCLLNKCYIIIRHLQDIKHTCLLMKRVTCTSKHIFFYYFIIQYYNTVFLHLYIIITPQLLVNCISILSLLTYAVKCQNYFMKL